MPLFGLGDLRRPFVDVAHFRPGSRLSFAARAGLLPAHWVFMPTPHSITPYIVPLELIYTYDYAKPSHLPPQPVGLVQASHAIPYDGVR